MVVIGSRAMHYWYPQTRIPKDYDVIGTKEELVKYLKDNYDLVSSCKISRPGKYMIKLLAGQSLEFEVTDPYVPPGSCQTVLSRSRYQPTVLYSEVNLECTVASPEILLAIKKSHLSVPLKRWGKHMEDYHFLKSKVRVDQLVFVHRILETQERITKRSANLNMTNEEFFAKSQPSVQRYYIHDDLHKATCYYKEPLFTKIKIDPDKAACNEALFKKLSHLDQIRAVREEAFSIALERKIIPAMMTYKPVDRYKALQYALFRICTTLTSGWFREFAQDNYYEILDCDVDYVSKFNNAVSLGTIKRTN